MVDCGFKSVSNHFPIFFHCPIYPRNGYIPKGLAAPAPGLREMRSSTKTSHDLLALEGADAMDDRYTRQPGIRGDWDVEMGLGHSDSALFFGGFVDKCHSVNAGALGGIFCANLSIAVSLVAGREIA